LCEDLSETFDVTVIAGQPNQNPQGAQFKRWGAERHQGVTIRRVPHLKLGKRSLLARALNMLTYLAWAAGLATFGARTDVVIVETDPFLLPLLGRCLKWRHRCKLIVYLQDIYPDIAVAMGKVREGWFTRFLRRRLVAAYRAADRVIVLGSDMRAVLCDAGVPADRITCLPNWVDTRRIYPIKTGNEFRLREQLDGQFVVMYSGNMGICQNLDEVLAAAERLRIRRDVQFVMVGDGASRARLEQSSRERQLSNVRFLPYQPLATLAHSLSAADLHLVPLDARVTGRVVPSKLYGILAAGAPALVVADERSEASRVIREAAAGRVVAPGNPQQLAEVIAWCADHRRELDVMGRRGRRLAEREYDRKTATGRFAKLLNNVLAGNPSDEWDATQTRDMGALRRKKRVSRLSRPVLPRSRASFLKGKRILVTGGAGFLSRSVCRSLRRFERAEIVVSRRAKCDLQKTGQIRSLIFDADPQVIVHLATEDSLHPDRYSQENALVGLQLMEEARLAGVEKFVSVGVFCSSAGRGDVSLGDEDRHWKVVTLLPVELYGPRDDFDSESNRMIPALIRRAIEARDTGRDHISVRGSGSTSHEFLFVRDAAKAIALAAERYDNSEPVDLGSGHKITTCELAEIICELCGFAGEIRWAGTEPDSPPRTCVDTKTAERQFGFRASTALRDGLIETIAWYERHRDGRKSKSLSDTDSRQTH
jgi:nucleoside-diphosphate-sugar epimerase/glycosyltransferase involved in cell wall biosynthesis